MRAVEESQRGRRRGPLICADSLAGHYRKEPAGRTSSVPGQAACFPFLEKKERMSASVSFQPTLPFDDPRDFPPEGGESPAAASRLVEELAHVCRERPLEE